MIPLQLKLRNFLSYGGQTQTIDFEPYHLICLSGKNGHGKSALLDALTWALWGQARKVHGTTKADEGLLRIGQTHMIVTLDFMCNQKKYRVTREFVKQNSKTHTELSFGIANKSGTFTSLNEKTTRATQQKIIETVGLDYESCTNSIFLRQGQSNEFSNKSPKERKEILANILGLNRYEELRKSALEKIRDATNSQKHLQLSLDKLNEELTKRSEIESAYTNILSEITTLEQNEKLIEKQLQEHEEKKQLFHQQQNKKTILEFQEQQINATITEKNNQLNILFTEWRRIRKQLRASTFGLTGFDKAELLKKEEKLEATRILIIKLKEDLLTHKTNLNNEHQRLSTDYLREHEQLSKEHTLQKLAYEKSKHLHQELEKKYIEKKSELKEYHITAQQLEQSLKKFETLDSLINKAEEQFDRRKQFYHQFITRGNQLRIELKNLHQKKDIGDSISTPSCPLCEQALSGARKRFLQTKLEHKAHFYTHQVNRLKKVVPELKELLVADHTQLTQYKKQLEEKTRLVQQHNALAKQIATLTELITTLKKECKTSKEEQEKQYKNLERASNKLLAHEANKTTYCTQNKEYKKLIETIQKLETEITNAIYDVNEHQKIKQQLQVLTQITEVAQQAPLQTKRKSDIHSLCTALKKLKREQATFSKERKKFDTLPEQQKKLATENTLAVSEYKLLLEKKNKILQSKGAHEQQLKLFEQHEKEFKEQTKKLATFDADIEDYQAISQALSKNGIQAFLIENALPEIEHEANLLLSKLTNNQSHIIIESLRDLKSGGTKETLDIKISDVLGIRPYEMFSGGEAFRIDFALRIAISKLLARRSGTSLQTLIIDEGFGSQDEEGLAHIMEALYKIQNDFAKIIIVSHLPSMKSQFPTHFFIHKQAHGSQVSVIEQG